MTVRDATMTKEREVTGTISVSVIEPSRSPCCSPTPAMPVDGAVNLSWTAGSFERQPDHRIQGLVDGRLSGEKSCGIW